MTDVTLYCQYVNQNRLGYAEKINTPNFSIDLPIKIYFSLTRRCYDSPGQFLPMHAWRSGHFHFQTILSQHLTSTVVAEEEKGSRTKGALLSLCSIPEITHISLYTAVCHNQSHKYTELQRSWEMWGRAWIIGDYEIIINYIISDMTELKMNSLKYFQEVVPKQWEKHDVIANI